MNIKQTVVAGLLLILSLNSFAQEKSKGIIGKGEVSIRYTDYTPHSITKKAEAEIEIIHWGEGKARVRISTSSKYCKADYDIALFALDKGLGSYDLFKAENDFLNDTSSIGSLIIYNESLVLKLNASLRLDTAYCSKSPWGSGHSGEGLIISLNPYRKQSFTIKKRF